MSQLFRLEQVAGCGVIGERARELLRVAGPDRLVWASDCPFVGHEGQFPYQATIDWLVDAIPDAGARDKIFGANARALFRWRLMRRRQLGAKQHLLSEICKLTTCKPHPPVWRPSGDLTVQIRSSSQRDF